MSSQVESQLDSCLAYEVLRNPVDWIGSASTKYLEGILAGAHLRASYTRTDLPCWRISGVLDDPAFYKQFVDATGHPTMSIRWATAIELTHFSLTEGFEELREKALSWHRLKGVDINENYKTCWLWEGDIDQFWSSLSRRPAMYMGDPSGWMLFCFLNGMDRGGDWLQLPDMPRLDEIFGRIKTESEKSCGTPFGAFRMCNAQTLLKWAGLPSDGD